MNPLGLFLDPPAPLLTHLHTVYMAYSECLPTRLSPLADGTCCPQVPKRTPPPASKGSASEPRRPNISPRSSPAATPSLTADIDSITRSATPSLTADIESFDPAGAPSPGR